MQFSYCMQKHIKTLTIYFNTEITYSEIPLFRGAVLQALDHNAPLLFHNHTGADTFRFSYPLIQYKRLHGKAALTCIEEGVDEVGQLMMNTSGRMNIGQREVECSVEKVQPARILVQTWNHSSCYKLHRWLPLNTKNYHLYQSMDNDNERMALLEQILKGNLLSMLKGLDIRIETELTVKITNLSEPYIIHNKGVAMMAFNADFSSNLSIPNNLGIGKNASIGYGVVHQIKNKNEYTNEN